MKGHQHPTEISTIIHKSASKEVDSVLWNSGEFDYGTDPLR